MGGDEPVGVVASFATAGEVDEVGKRGDDENLAVGKVGRFYLIQKLIDRSKTY
jgi:hypothetical protein